MERIFLVIPCYNEGKRLPLIEYESFLEQSDQVSICFVNDGSSDNTLAILHSLCNKFNSKAHLISYPKNAGKAEAVRRGVAFCSQNFNFKYIGYFDADLSTPLTACFKLKSYLTNGIEFSFGSRIMKIGSVIERSFKRHLIGRIIATIISNMLKMKVYDTQCGSKLFTKDLSVYLFKDPFISKWLFDVELFFRMIKKYGMEEALIKMIEVPLDRWINKDDSKVKITYFFKLWLDLFAINKKYKKDLIKQVREKES
jgi:dolichyl-phosphate beta-glucosyltransferase